MNKSFFAFFYHISFCYLFFCSITFYDFRYGAINIKGGPKIKSRCKVHFKLIQVLSHLQAMLSFSSHELHLCGDPSKVMTRFQLCSSHKFHAFHSKFFTFKTEFPFSLQIFHHSFAYINKSQI